LTTWDRQAVLILCGVGTAIVGRVNKWEKIAAANGNIKPESLQVGQKFTIPA
jgi:nucleoid-associated protein YgaU